MGVSSGGKSMALSKLYRDIEWGETGVALDVYTR